MRVWAAAAAGPGYYVLRTQGPVSSIGPMEWRIHHDLPGGWRWACYNKDGVLMAEAGGFRTYDACVEEARRNGYRMPDDAGVSIVGGTKNATHGSDCQNDQEK